MTSSLGRALRRGAFSAHYLVFGYRPQFHSDVGGPLSAGEGALGEVVRQRDLLRSRAQALFLEIRASETLRKAPRESLSDARGVPPSGNIDEFRPRDDPQGVYWSALDRPVLCDCA